MQQGGAIVTRKTFQNGGSPVNDGRDKKVDFFVDSQDANGPSLTIDTWSSCDDDDDTESIESGQQALDEDGPSPKPRGPMVGVQDLLLTAAARAANVQAWHSAVLQSRRRSRRISRHAISGLESPQSPSSPCPGSPVSPGSFGGSPSSRDCASPTTRARNQTSPNIILFDWDDTLLPTTFIKDTVQATMPEEARFGPLPEGSPFIEPLAAYGRWIRKILLSASAVGKVAIITLAARPWVDNSCSWFLPGCRVMELLEELEIPVFYAREYLRKRDKRAAVIEEGVDLFTVAKRYALRSFLRSYCKSTRRASLEALSVLSIGDSPAEIDALIEIMWDEAANQEGNCKIVRFIPDPSIEVLQMELQLLSTWFPKLVAFEGDIEVDMGSSPNTNESVRAFLAK